MSYVGQRIDWIRLNDENHFFSLSKTIKCVEDPSFNDLKPVQGH